jgi:uncharacterized protein YdaU (DUF1376 family)
MHYYAHHIADFRCGTIHLSRQERWLYRDMVEVYYDTERPLPADPGQVCRKLGIPAQNADERTLVELLLAEFFTLTDEGWRHTRCDEEIEAYRLKADRARSNGAAGGRPKQPKNNPVGSEPVPTHNPDETGSKTNQEPITNNHKPEEPKTLPGKPGPSPSESVVGAKARKVIEVTLPPGLSPDQWEAFVKYRKQIKHPLTQIAAERLIAEITRLAAIGCHPHEVLDQSIRNGWRGIFEVKSTGAAPHARNDRDARRAATVGLLTGNPSGGREIVQ